jgi:hypothetical protein
LFDVEEMDAIVNGNGVTDQILVLRHFNFPKLKWMVQADVVTLQPMNVETDQESHLIEGMLGYGWMNLIPSQVITVKNCGCPLLSLIIIKIHQNLRK